MFTCDPHYKIHWVRRSTKKKRINKAKCVLDILVYVALVVYGIGGIIWMFFDAFPM